MKRIGIIGGLAWPSTITYYETINKEIERRTGHTPVMTISQPDFCEIKESQGKGDWENVACILGRIVRSLEDSGAQLILMASNTVHNVYEEISEMVDVPIVHIADSLGERLKRDGIERIGLLGTRYTMEMDFIKKRLKERYGVDSFIPSEKNADSLDQVIFSDITEGEISEKSREVITDCIRDVKEQKVQAIVLGCTELGLAISASDVKMPVYDTTLIHCMDAVEKVLNI